MKILSAKAHGVIDYLFVVFLLLSPTIFKPGQHVAMFMYALGGVHLLLTMFTKFDLGIIKAIPFRIHGLIELAVAIGLGALAVWFRTHEYQFGFYYCMSLAVLILIIFNITDFRSTETDGN